MGRCPRAAAISGVMRHGTLAYRAGTRVSRDVVGSSGRATVARPAGDGAGAARAASRRGASWPDASRKGAVCGSHVAQNALFRHVAAREAWGATPRQPAGHYEKWPNWANASGQPPARLRGGCAGTCRPRPPHGKAQSGQRASLMARPGPGRDTIRLPVVGYGGTGNSG